jgi:hypothetical protein
MLIAMTDVLRAMKYFSRQLKLRFMRRSHNMCHGLFLLIFMLLASGCGMSVAVSGLKPEYPKLVTGGSGIAFFEVDSLQPTFRWESFPRPQDLNEDKDGLIARIDNVTYDLNIWRAQDEYPVEVIYSRQRLLVSMHVMEEPLEPSTKYFWSVRARFEVEGRTRVTEWGVALGSGRSPVVPNPFYYRFKTPSE